MDAVRQFLRVIFYLLMVGLLLLVGAVVGTIAADAVFGPRATDVSNVSYSGADGTELVAYLNIPPNAEILPAVILLPNHWGLNSQTIRLANLLSEAGYVVIAPDLFRGASSGVLTRALLLSGTTAEAQVMQDVQSAYDYLTGLDVVQADSVGILGLGYGGGMAVRFAAEQPGIGATVTAYGDVPTRPDLLAELNGPVLGVFGELDLFVTPDQAERFKAALETADMPHEVVIYDALGHDFLTFPQITVEGALAGQVWQRVVRFFDQNLS